jgi:hypothetical protein
MSQKNREEKGEEKGEEKCSNGYNKKREIYFLIGKCIFIL